MVPTITSVNSGDAELVPNNESLIIGADFPFDAEFWFGKIDEVQIWSKVLSRGQIRANMRRSSTPRSRDGSLVGFWKFEEGVGATTTFDESRYNNDGSLVGGVMFVSPGAR